MSRNDQATDQAILPCLRRGQAVGARFPPSPWLRRGWCLSQDEPHPDAFVWNALDLAETAERIRLGILREELDNLPKIGTATPEEQGIPHAL